MVISGGNFAPDILKPKEVVSLLLDDDEMERKCVLISCVFIIHSHLTFPWIILVRFCHGLLYNEIDQYDLKCDCIRHHIFILVVENAKYY